MPNFEPNDNNDNEQNINIQTTNESPVIDVIGEVIPAENAIETNSLIITTDENLETQLAEQQAIDTENFNAKLTFKYEFNAKQEVTNIQEYLFNIWASYVPSLYKQINAGITSDVAKDTFWKILNSKFFQIQNNPQFIQNPNIVISSQKGAEPSQNDEHLGLFCSLVLLYNFKGTIEQLPFMNLVNIIPQENNTRSITTINPSNDQTEIIVETLIEEKNLQKFLEAITQRIQEENKNIQIAYSQFFTEYIQLIDKEYQKNQKIREFFSTNNPLAFK